MPLRPCSVGSCRNKVKIPESYCELHKDQSNKNYNKHVRFNQDNEKYSKFYSTQAWRTVRRNKLMRDPMCEVCAAEGRITKADMVHHICELRTPVIGWERRLDPHNLQSVCYNCHTKIEHEYSNNSKKYKK